MKKKILHNWHTVRVVYLLIGLMIAVYSVMNKEWTGLLPGGYFMAMAVFHFGCATGGCYVPPVKNTEYTAEAGEPVFEEIK